jgi:steroid delta-isomerase-like uncharacterized protein
MMKKLFKLLPLALTLCFMASCQNKAEKAELEKYRTQAKVEEQNRALVSRMWEAWNKRDFEAWKEMHAPEYLYYSPSNSAKPLSREETIEMGKSFFVGFPDAISKIEEPTALGSRVISIWIMTGTHEGEFAGIPPTGNKIECSGIMVTQIENGIIVEDKEEADMLTLMQQLGMELKPKETEKK